MTSLNLPLPLPEYDPASLQTNRAGAKAAPKKMKVGCSWLLPHPSACGDFVGCFYGYTASGQV